MKALELKAQSGDHKAQYKLGEIYAVGNKEIEKNGNEAAQYILGNF
jgi:TPR repeat protein